MGLIYSNDADGRITWPSLLVPTGRQPLDNRTVVQSESDLQVSTTFKNKAYVGMLVYVTQTNSFWVLKDEANNTWTQLPTLDNLDSLSKAFQFKGVASAIDSDNCTLTIGSALDSNDKAMTVIKQVTDVEGDLYYGWSSDTTIQYWTRGKLENGVTTYTLTEKTDVASFVYNNATYYYSQESRTVDGTTFYEFLSVDGDAYWTTTTTNGQNQNIYAAPAGIQVATVTIKTTDHVYWAVESDSVSGITGTSETETASDSNIGWVYQLGENEYASNGKIWVQLGNPREDWIII